jgi:hypothetical protein
VWWLERRAPDRFGPRRAGVVTSRQLKAYVGILADVVAGEKRAGTSREEILGRLKAFAESVDQLLKNERMLEEETELLSDRIDDSEDATAD